MIKYLLTIVLLSIPGIVNAQEETPHHYLPDDVLIKNETNYPKTPLKAIPDNTILTKMALKELNKYHIDLNSPSQTLTEMYYKKNIQETLDDDLVNEIVDLYLMQDDVTDTQKTHMAESISVFATWYRRLCYFTNKNVCGNVKLPTLLLDHLNAIAYLLNGWVPLYKAYIYMSDYQLFHDRGYFAIEPPQCHFASKDEETCIIMVIKPYYQTKEVSELYAMDTEYKNQALMFRNSGYIEGDNPADEAILSSDIYGGTAR